jgi:hypothetical protein
MSEGTEGVLLRSADGGHYFIPHTDLGQYEVGGAGGDLGDRVAQAAPRIDAFSVSRTVEEDENVSFFPMPEG